MQATIYTKQRKFITLESADWRFHLKIAAMGVNCEPEIGYLQCIWRPHRARRMLASSKNTVALSDLFKDA